MFDKGVITREGEPEAEDWLTGPVSSLTRCAFSQYFNKQNAAGPVTMARVGHNSVISRQGCSRPKVKPRSQVREVTVSNSKVQGQAQACLHHRLDKEPGSKHKSNSRTKYGRAPIRFLTALSHIALI